MSSDSHSSNQDRYKIYIETEQQKDQKLMHVTSATAVWRAFGANICIAFIKLVCWFFSKSSAMLSEAIHSLVDSFNSLCLLVGLKRGSRPADKFHPFGYGLEANIWALFASLLMLVGTTVSVYSGINKLVNDHNEVLELLNNYHWIALALLGSIFFEAWAVSSASYAVTEEAEVPTSGRLESFLKSFKYIKKIKSPTTKFVWYEDTAALAGVMVAFVALSISKYVVSTDLAYIPDAIASIIIGLILLGLAIYLLKNNINSLTGAAAEPHVETKIKQLVSTVHGISQLHDLKTMDMGSSGLIVNLKIEVDADTPVKDADNIAENLENRIKESIKNVAHVTIEMQADDAEEEWEEKFNKVIKLGEDTDVLKPNEAKMLSNFFDFTNKVVDEIMIPRTEVVFCDANSDINYLIDLVINSGHTRIPLYKDSIDNIIGLINAKDVLRAVKENLHNNVSIEELAREILIVPENKSISDMFNEFSKSKSQLAAIIDEHGGVSGIVTVEDIIEEIVGEIYDEFDVVQADEITRVDENTISIAAKFSIDDFNERFGLDLPTEDFQTVGGFVFGLLGREPEVEDSVEDHGIKFKITAVEGHKITTIEMSKEDGFRGVMQEEKTEESEAVEGTEE